MDKVKATAAGLAALLWLAGCASTPKGPTIQVMPAAGKPFEAFQQDQAICKQYARQEVTGEAKTADEKALGATLLGAGLGAGLGAAADGGRGAGIGAAAGGLLGTGIGAGGAARSQRELQQRYDNAYAQCMYAKGNQVMPAVRPAPVVVTPPAVVYVAPPPAVVVPSPPPPPPASR